MSKKKDSVALFEVISKSRQRRSEAGLNIPGWMGPGQGSEGAESPPPSETPAAPTRSPTIGPPATREAMVSTAGGELRLALNYFSCIVAAFALVLLLAGAFWLGRVTAGAPVAKDPGEQGGEKASVKGLAEPASAPPREPGKYYLVVQGLQGTTQQHYSAAQEIVAYLKKNYIPADVNLYPGSPKQYIVWSLDGFDKLDSDAAKGFVRKIESLGQRYRAQGGRYDFRPRPGENPRFIRKKSPS